MTLFNKINRFIEKKEKGKLRKHESILYAKNKTRIPTKGKVVSSSSALSNIVQFDDEQFAHGVEGSIFFENDSVYKGEMRALKFEPIHKSQANKKTDDEIMYGAANFHVPEQILIELRNIEQNKENSITYIQNAKQLQNHIVNVIKLRLSSADRVSEYYLKKKSGGEKLTNNLLKFLKISLKYTKNDWKNDFPKWRIIVMEKLHGKSLEEFIRQKVIDDIVFREIMLQIMFVLIYLPLYTGLKHNDAHAGNWYICELDKDMTMEFWINDIHYKFKTKHLVKIIDYGFSTFPGNNIIDYVNPLTIQKDHEIINTYHYTDINADTLKLFSHLFELCEINGLPQTSIVRNFIANIIPNNYAYAMSPTAFRHLGLAQHLKSTYLINVYDVMKEYFFNYSYDPRMDFWKDIERIQLYNPMMSKDFFSVFENKPRPNLLYNTTNSIDQIRLYYTEKLGLIKKKIFTYELLFSNVGQFSKNYILYIDVIILVCFIISWLKLVKGITIGPVYNMLLSEIPQNMSLVEYMITFNNSLIKQFDKLKFIDDKLVKKEKKMAQTPEKSTLNQKTVQQYRPNPHSLLPPQYKSKSYVKQQPIMRTQQLVQGTGIHRAKELAEQFKRDAIFKQQQKDANVYKQKRHEREQRRTEKMEYNRRIREQEKQAENEQKQRQEVQQKEAEQKRQKRKVQQEQREVQQKEAERKRQKQKKQESTIINTSSIINKSLNSLVKQVPSSDRITLEQQRIKLQKRQQQQLLQEQKDREAQLQKHNNGFNLKESSRGIYRAIENVVRNIPRSSKDHITYEQHIMQPYNELSETLPAISPQKINYIQKSRQSAVSLPPPVPVRTYQHYAHRLFRNPVFEYDYHLDPNRSVIGRKYKNLNGTFSMRPHGHGGKKKGSKSQRKIKAKTNQTKKSKLQRKIKPKPKPKSKKQTKQKSKSKPN
jgi:hypothetical protein